MGHFMADDWETRMAPQGAAPSGTCQSRCSVPDGLYDNPRMMRRERWEDGKVVEWITAAALAKAGRVKFVYGDAKAWRTPWREYPDAQNAQVDAPSGARSAE